MKGWVYDRNSLRDFIGFVVLYAPDFPEEDYLAPEEQLTMAAALEEIREGLQYISKKVTEADLEQLERVEQAYLQGDSVAGGDTLLGLQTRWFGR